MALFTREELEETLKEYGWEINYGFSYLYIHNAWFFNVVNALVLQHRRIKELEAAHESQTNDQG